MKSKIKHSKYCTFDNEAVGIFVLMQIVAQLQSECIIPKFALQTEMSKWSYSSAKINKLIFK